MAEQPVTYRSPSLFVSKSKYTPPPPQQKPDAQFNRGARCAIRLTLANSRSIGRTLARISVVLGVAEIFEDNRNRLKLVVCFPTLPFRTHSPLGRWGGGVLLPAGGVLCDSWHGLRAQAMSLTKKTVFL